MDKTENKKTGNYGEQLACDYLIQRKYKIIARNLNLFCGEIDILAEKDKTLVIVEVKTVRGGGYGLAQDLVRFKKKEKLRNLARALGQKYPNRSIRIDVIGVNLADAEKPKIEHIVSAVSEK